MLESTWDEVDAATINAKIVSSEAELMALGTDGKTKPKRVFWDDELRGGSFTLSENPEADDGGIWFNGYRRDFSGDVLTKWFGVDDLSIKKCHDYANSNNLKVFASGDILLTGTSVVNIETDCDYSNANIVVDGWSGNFKITGNTVTEYISGDAIFDKLQASATISKNSSYIDTLSDEPSLKNSYIQVETNTPIYTYRGANVNYTEYNLITNKGLLIKPLIMDLTNVSKLRVLKSSGRILKIKGFSISEKNLSSLLGGILFDIQRNDTIVESTYFERDDNFALFNGDRIRVSNAYNVKIEDVIGLPIDNSDASYGYLTRFDSSMKVTVEGAFCDGIGWGATGNRQNRDITFMDSSLSRIDFHEVLYERLLVENCSIGAAAITLSCIGDVVANNNRLVLRQQDITGGRSLFISTRNDCGGGFMDGNLYVNGLSVIGKDTTLTSADFTYDKFFLVYADGTNQYSDVILDKNLINNVRFNSIFAENIKIDDSTIGMYPFLYAADGVDTYKAPLNISILNSNVNMFTLKMSYFELPNYSVSDTSIYENTDFNMSLILDNVSTDNVIISGNRTDVGLVTKITLNNAKPTVFKIGQNGKCDIENTVLSCLETTVNNGYIRIGIGGMSKIIPSAAYDLNDDTTHGIYLINTGRHIVSISNSMTEIIDRTHEIGVASCKISCCQIRKGYDSNYAIPISSTDGSSVIDVPLVIGNTYQITSGYSGDSSNFCVSYMHMRTSDLNKVATSSGYIVFSPDSSDLNISTASDDFRNIKLIP